MPRIQASLPEERKSRPSVGTAGVSAVAAGLCACRGLAAASFILQFLPPPAQEPSSARARGSGAPFPPTGGCQRRRDAGEGPGLCRYRYRPLCVVPVRGPGPGRGLVTCLPSDPRLGLCGSALPRPLPRGAPPEGHAVRPRSLRSSGCEMLPWCPWLAFLSIC